MENNFNQQNNVQMAVDAALQQEKANKKKKKKKIILIVFAVLLAIIVIAAVSGGDDDEKSNNASSSNTSSSVQADEESNSSEGVKAQEKESKKGEIGNYVCTIKKVEKCKNYDGKPAVKITYAFTNNASEPESFDMALSDNVYQDGIGLEDAFFTGEDEDMGFDVKIKPGVTKEVRKTYLLKNETSDLEVEISEFISLSNDKLTETVKL